MSINNEKQTRKWNRDRDREINKDVEKERKRGKEKGPKFSLQIAKRINKTFVLFVPVCCCCFIFCSNFMKSVCALVFICCGSVVVYVSSFVLDTKSGLSKNQITLFSLSLSIIFRNFLNCNIMWAMICILLNREYYVFDVTLPNYHAN